MTAVAQPSEISPPTIYLVDPANCTALILDRKTNSTVMKRCPQEGLALRLQANSERESLAVVGDPAIRRSGDHVDALPSGLTGSQQVTSGDPAHAL
jgi:hypothetical protein